MTSRTKLLLALGVAFLLGGIVGAGAGLYYGFDFGTSYLLKDWLVKDARDVQAQVLVLRHLRNNRTDQAVEMIESRLDDQVILFQPDEPFKRLTPRETSSLHKAISELKDYRAEYPRQSRRKFVDDAVRHLFADDPYK